MADKSILLVLTGGTICSFADSDNSNRDTDMLKAKRLLLDNFEHSGSEFSGQQFDERMPMDILSENMTPAKWNLLIEDLKSVDYDDYKGVIIAHGTDTLAYSAALLSLILANVDKPVFIVSSNLTLDDPAANGNDNFKTAVELICGGFERGVYVSYRNDDGEMYIHKASHLLQCMSYAENFYSNDALKPKDYIPGAKWETYNMETSTSLTDIGVITDNVLYIRPYVGLDYSLFRIDDNIKAVVHGTYHSQTACVERKNKGEAYSSKSILHLIDKCRERQIPVIVGPCREDIALYSSAADMIQYGAIPVYGMTDEMLYVKTVVGIALGYDSKALIDFLRRDICGEYIIKKEI